MASRKAIHFLGILDARAALHGTLRAMDISYSIVMSSLGYVLVASSGRGVCCVMFGDDARALEKELSRRFPSADLVAKEAPRAMVSAVTAFVEQPEAELNVPLDLRGTPFQKKVWDALRTVPVGTTSTYKEIAVKIGKPSAVRAVAQACGANHVALAVPCHRIVKSDGSLSGYRWGVHRKATLLEREKNA